MKFKLSIIVLLVMSVAQLFSQLPNRGCGTPVPDAQYDALFQQKVLDYLNQNSTANRTQATYQIPVIIHVIHNGEAVGVFPNIAQLQLNSQIQVLNDDYAGTGFNSANYPSTAFQTYATNTVIATASKDGTGRIGISNTGLTFCLALKDSLGNFLPEPGIERKHWNSISGASNPTTFTTTGSFMTYMNTVVKPATIWSPNKYLNIWVSDVFASGLIGFSTFPPLSGLPGVSGGGTATTDGVWFWAKCFGSQNIYPSGVYDATYNYGRTATHELSHYLGIKHIWGDANCGTDYCNDTPAQQGPNYNLQTYPYLPNNCPSTIPPTGPEGIMFMNFADYTNDAGMYMFTDEQKIRMQTAMVNSPYRNQLGIHGFCNSGPIPPVANFKLSDSIICQGQSVSITDLSTPTGSIASWYYTCAVASPSNSTLQNPTFTFNSPGTHTITLNVTSGGVNASSTKTIQVTPATVVNTNSQNVSCFGMCNGSASVTANGSGPFTYSWSPIGATTALVTGLCAGTYTCVVINSCGISISKIVSIIQPPAIVLNPSVSNPSVCSGNSSTLSVSPSGGVVPYNFNWSTGATLNSINVTPAVIPTSTYNIIVTDASGCTASKIFSLSVYPTPTITANHLPFLPICAGKTATINLSGAVNYTTNPGTITVSTFTVNPPVTTVYTIVGKSAQGCTGFASDTIKVYATPTILSNVNTNTLCAGSILTFSNAGGSTYTLNPSALTGSVITTFPSPAGTTIYTVSGTNALGCINSKTISITTYSLPNVSVSPSNTTICSGQSLVLTASGANTYSWNNGATTSSMPVTPTGNTTYTVVGTNNNGCQNSATTSVNVVPTPIVSISSPSTNVCFGYTMTLTASVASNYQWFNGTTANTTTVQPLSNITYSVIGNNGGACADTAYLPITILPLPSVSALVSNTLVCVGQTVNINASGTAITYTWMPGFMQGPNQTVQIFTPTTFTAYGQGSNGCVFFSTAFVNVQSVSAIIPVATPSAVCIGDTAVLSVIGGSVPSWSNNSVPNTNIVTPTINTTYSVNAIDFNGCISDIIFYVDINLNCDVITYNGFTPNGDGINDFWIIDNIEKYPNNRVYIYNRWGNKIFETLHYDNKSNIWDGKLNGKPITSGTYFYIITTNNEKLFKKGWIEITN